MTSALHDFQTAEKIQTGILGYKLQQLWRKNPLKYSELTYLLDQQKRNSRMKLPMRFHSLFDKIGLEHNKFLWKKYINVDLFQAAREISTDDAKKIYDTHARGVPQSQKKHLSQTLIA